MATVHLLMMVNMVLRSLASAPAAPLDLNGTHVFYNGLAGVVNYRIPAVVQTRTSALVAFAEARHGGDDTSYLIAVRTSYDDGATWSPVVFAAGSVNSSAARKSCAANRTSCRAGNPTATYDQARGVVVLVYRMRGFGEGSAAVGNGMVISTDDGLTWSDPRDISRDFGVASASSPGPGTALSLEVGPHAGRLLVASWHGIYGRDYVSLSDDHGASWRTINTSFPRMSEAALTQLPNGSVLLNMRHRESPKLGRAVAVSLDDGETFGPIQYDPVLVSPVCQASIVSFDGVVYFSNPASREGRTHLTIRKSTDNCATWSAALLVETNRSAGYSCLVKGALHADPSSGGILYEAHSGSMDFARFPLSLATAPLTVHV